MLLIYSHQLTSRLKYTFKQVCTRILGIPIDFTNKVEDFVAFNGPKLSYTQQQLGNEFHIKCHGLLFEQGLTDVEIIMHDWEGIPCFFSAGEKSALPYDIFAASFYLISRYEEYLPHVRDEYGRFSADDSLAHKHGFLEEPVVDQWAYRFKSALMRKFDNLSYEARTYSVDPVIDVPMAFYFRRKGLMRTIGGSMNDIIRLNFKRLYERYLTILGVLKDPYDTFDWIIDLQKKHTNRFKVFFLIGDYSTYDKNVSIHKKSFVTIIKSIADYCRVGLKASYFATEQLDILKKEQLNLEAVVNTNVIYNRNSFSRLNLPFGYRHLVELEMAHDYTMGYVNRIGFRAGTCTPFLFYDLDYEVQTPLLLHPFHLMDYTLLRHKSMLDKTECVFQLIEKIKAVNGVFTPVFHNYSFSNDPRWKGFDVLFVKMLTSQYETEQR